MQLPRDGPYPVYNKHVKKAYMYTYNHLHYLPLLKRWMPVIWRASAPMGQVGYPPNRMTHCPPPPKGDDYSLHSPTKHFPGIYQVTRTFIWTLCPNKILQHLFRAYTDTNPGNTVRIQDIFRTHHVFLCNLQLIFTFSAIKL